MHVSQIKIFLLALTGIVLVSLSQNASATVQLDPHMDYLYKNGVFFPYTFTDNSTATIVNSLDGSAVFNKNTCSVSFYNSTDNHGSPIISSDAYSVLASNTNNGTSNWIPVNIINNAACSTTVNTFNDTISVLQTKTVSGAGTFVLNYTKTINHPFKLSYSATNNNPTWTNYHLGIEETMTIPKSVSLGNATYDLSQYNNTVLNRSWINSHSSQLIRLAANLHYNIGVAWNNINKITVHWINNKASLVLDYTYNTPIISPSQTITIDPTLDGSVQTVTGTTPGATTNISITVGSNSNRALIVVATEYAGTGSGNVTSVKIGSTSFTEIKDRGDALGTSSMWYLIAPSTGSQTITVTWGFHGAGDYLTIGAYSLYNVAQTSTIGVTNSDYAASGIQSGDSLKPTNTGAWLIDSLMVRGASPSAPWTQPFNINSGSTIYGTSQYNSSPIINSANSMVYTMGGANGFVWVGAEIKAAAATPSIPSLTHINTLNNTAVKLDWPSVSGATYYLINYTTPASGSTWTQLNVTTNTKTINGLTAGTQYAGKIAAGNSTGSSLFGSFKSNYTYNIAPTSLTATVYSNSSARLTVTNPSGNFSGYKIFKASPTGGTYSLVTTTSNTTNHYDFTGLAGNTQYQVKASTQYAKGTNATGFSSNSTALSFYTLPGAPNALTTTKTSNLHIRLNWNAPNDNGTISGYKIEQYISSWSTLVANTGNTTTHYDSTIPSAGQYSWRVSTIKYGGTSIPTTVTSTFAATFTVNAYHANGLTPVYGGVFQTNSTLKTLTNFYSFTAGSATINGILGLNNFTIYNSLINFIVGNQYNYNATTFHSLNITTNDFNVDCPFTGTGPDLEVFTNGTNGHRTTFPIIPTCYANNTMNWKTYFAASGNHPASYNTVVYVKVLNSTYLNNATLKWNATKVSTALSNPYLISAYVPVGTGLQTSTLYWSMNMTLNPAFVAANFTVGHISVSGSNHLVMPIQLTVTKPSPTLTTVTAVYPTTYNMVYSAQLNSAQKTINYTNVSAQVDVPQLGESTATFNYQFPSNDTILFTARDTLSNQSASATLNPPISSIPMVSQIVLWKTGAYGTTGMFGPIDLVTFIVIIISFIGMNRVNETIGVFFGIAIIFVAGFFQLVSYPSVFIMSLILSLLITVASTKKLPWS